MPEGDPEGLPDGVPEGDPEGVPEGLPETLSDGSDPLEEKGGAPDGQGICTQRYPGVWMEISPSPREPVILGQQ